MTAVHSARRKLFLQLRIVSPNQMRTLPLSSCIIAKSLIEIYISISMKLARDPEGCNFAGCYPLTSALFGSLPIG